MSKGDVQPKRQKI